VVHYFAGGVEGDAASAISFIIFQERRRIGYRFRLSCVKRMRHRSHRKRFFDANYQMASVIIKYRKRVLIILMSICIKYDILTLSYNTT